MTQPTLDELRSAWEAMRQRHSLRHWPAEFDQVMADPLRAACVSLEAKAARRRPCKQQPVWIGIDRASRPDQTTYWRPSPNHTPDLFDRKRAAAGDTDD
jgi:hypothetical protein